MTAAPNLATSNALSNEAPCKRAGELNLEELELTAETRELVKRKGYANEYLVMQARTVAHHLTIGGNRKFLPTPEWLQELVKAVEAAGFIRWDLRPRTVRVWWLYLELERAMDRTYKAREFNLLYEQGKNIDLSFYRNVLTAIDRDFIFKHHATAVKQWHGLLDEGEWPLSGACHTLSEYRTLDPTHSYADKYRRLEKDLPRLAELESVRAALAAEQAEMAAALRAEKADELSAQEIDVDILTMIDKWDRERKAHPAPKPNRGKLFRERMAAKMEKLAV